MLCSASVLVANLKVALVTEPQQVRMKAAFSPSSLTRWRRELFSSSPGFSLSGYTDKPDLNDIVVVVFLDPLLSQTCQ